MIRHRKMITLNSYPKKVEIINPDFNKSFNSSLNLSYICFFELARRELLYPWQNLPALTLNRVAYAVASKLRHSELYEFSRQIAKLEITSAPKLNLLSIWEQHAENNEQIAEAVREYILLVTKYKPPIQKRPDSTTRIKIYHEAMAAGNWRRPKNSKNALALKLDDGIDIIKSLVRKRQLARKTAEFYITNIATWADLSPERLDIVAKGLMKLSNHPSLTGTEDSKKLESISLLIETGEIKKMHQLSKKDYSLEDTFLGEKTTPAIDKEAQLRGREKLQKLLRGEL